MKMIYTFIILVFVYVLCHTQALNLRPIIGILSQEPSPSMVEGEKKNYTSYIAASYVKFMESAGARVTPIMINRDESYYKEIASSVNGILFPGGGNSIYNDSGYGLAGQILYKEILKRNAHGHYLPLWATCLGFEMLLYLSASFVNPRESCDALNIALPLIPTRDCGKSQLFSEMPRHVFQIVTSQNVTSNFHKWCITEQGMIRHGLDRDYFLLTKSFDSQNLEFVSTVEHKTLPFFGSQWHPEKNAYEWKNSDKYNSIPHTSDAIYSVQYFGDFFVNQARQSDQSFQSESEEENHLIYAFQPTYKGNSSSSFEQIYLFE